MKKLLTLSALPASSDLALLALRLWFGLPLLINHGWPKLLTFSEKAATFSDPLGIGHTPSMIGAILGEVACSTLLILGLGTRLAAVGAGFTMCVALFIAGAGKFSLDRKMGAAS
jgi:putative oxidoreductase